MTDEGTNGDLIPFPKSGQSGSPEQSPPGKRRPRPRGGRPDKLEILRKEREALELRKAELPLEEIARRVGYKDASGVHRAIERAYERHIVTDAREIFTLELGRLSTMTRALWPKVLQGDTKAIDSALRVSERLAKLTGLERTTVQLTGADGGPLNVQVVADVTEFISLLAAVAVDVTDGGLPRPILNGEVIPTNGAITANGEEHVPE